MPHDGRLGISATGSLMYRPIADNVTTEGAQPEPPDRDRADSEEIVINLCRHDGMRSVSAHCRRDTAGMSRDWAPSHLGNDGTSVTDDFVKPFNQLGQFFGGCFADLFSNALDGKCSNLADLDPRTLW